MKKLYFITGNKGKFKEAKAIFPELEQLDIDLPEIQSLEPKEIIESKIIAAFEHIEGRFIVDDVSFYLDCMNGLPGPFIKWFLKTVGNKGLLKIANSYGNTKTHVSVTVGFAESKDDIQFFSAELEGNVVSERGGEGFGFDTIFEVKNRGKTLAELSIDEKNSLYPRGVALNKLRDYFEKE